jgi:hypothetical protein
LTAVLFAPTGTKAHPPLGGNFPLATKPTAARVWVVPPAQPHNGKPLSRFVLPPSAGAAAPATPPHYRSRFAACRNAPSSSQRCRACRPSTHSRPHPRPAIAACYIRVLPPTACLARPKQRQAASRLVLAVPKRSSFKKDNVKKASNCFPTSCPSQVYG